MDEVKRSLARRSSTRGACTSTRPAAVVYLARGSVAVADHEPAAGGIQLFGVALEVGAAFGLQCHRDHLPRRQSAELVQIDALVLKLSLRARVMHYPQHPAYSSLPANNRHSFHLLREGTPPLFSQPVHNFRV